MRRHFERFPLETSKRFHFDQCCAVMDIIINKDHLEIEGIQAIALIKSMFPNGLNKDLLSLVQGQTLPSKPLFVPSTSPLHPDWIAGFVTADGSFSLG